MTEEEFWAYCYKLAKEKRPIGGHVMPELPLDKVVEMGNLLMQKGVTAKAKSTILITLAHIPEKTALGILKAYNRDPDKQLRIFAEIALDECEFWNEE